MFCETTPESKVIDCALGILLSKLSSVTVALPSADSKASRSENVVIVACASIVENPKTTLVKIERFRILPHQCCRTDQFTSSACQGYTRESLSQKGEGNKFIFCAGWSIRGSDQNPLYGYPINTILSILQNGFTITMITMTISARNGTSFMMRQNFSVRGRSPFSNFRRDAA